MSTILNSLIIFGAEYLPCLVAASLFIFLWFRKERVLAFKVLVAGLSALAVAEIIKYLFYTPRPFIVGSFVPLIKPDLDGAFPSSHTAVLIAMGTALLRCERWLGIIILVVGAIVGLCRVVAGVHYPIDIIGGFALGGVVGYGIICARKYFTRRN